MNKNLLNNVTRGIHKIGFKFKKHSPEILVVAGIVGGVTSAVMACKATTKLDKVLKEPKDKIDQIHEYVEKNGFSEKYTEEDSKNDLRIMYTQAGVKVAKLYAPSIILGAVSITAILSGHKILRKRNVALAAAYTAVDKGFKEYRGRVIERFGKELDRELRYNVKAKEIEETVLNEDGTETKEKKVVEVVSDPLPSEYAKFYDDGCIGWTKDPEHNKRFLILQQSIANDLLQSRGYLFLNDVYEMLGIPKTKAGYVVGWIYDKNHPVGDNEVDFGIFDMEREKNRDFVNGYERTILLDFNVDGNILDMM